MPLWVVGCCWMLLGVVCVTVFIMLILWVMLCVVADNIKKKSGINTGLLRRLISAILGYPRLSSAIWGYACRKTVKNPLDIKTIS